jgi:uncharacterized membrane protein
MYNDLYLDRIAAAEAEEAEVEARIQQLIEEIEALDSLQGPAAQQLSHDLRSHVVTDDVYDELAEHSSFGERLADDIATIAGSWGFIVGFLLFMGVWILSNIWLSSRAFDTYPFILLNLGLSTLAALQAPVILMSQNRQADKDRAVARNDFEVNLKTEIEIADLHRKVDSITAALEIQNRQINALVSARRQEVNATVQAMEKARQSGRTDGTSDKDSESDS